MPVLPEKRRGGHHGGSSRQRRSDYGASPVDSSDGSITNSGDDGASPSGSPDDEPWVTGRAYESRYHEIVASRLAQLQLPAGADDDGSDFDHLPNQPSVEIIEALTRKSFHDDESRAALVEYQCHKFLSETQGRDRDSADVNMDFTCTEPDDVIPKEEYSGYRQVLRARMAAIDTYTELDQEQTNVFHLKRALYHIKAALLLKGMSVDELDDDAALQRKYPPKLMVENDYFFHYVDDGYFGWYFDSDLCYKEFLTDY
ncbi:unnamed protein product [Alopecurus aequalis]